MRVLDQSIGRIVAPRLAALGFERRRNLWNRRRWLWMDAIEVQQSGGNTRLEGRFTVNLAVGPWRRGWRRPVDLPPRQVRRIGQLRPDGQDHWWRYDPADPASAEASARAMLADLETYGLPYLNRWPLEGVPGWAWVRRLSS